MRALPNALVSLALVLSGAHAHAEASADVCASAYARGQEERLSGRLFSARKAFLECSAAACPRSISADCVRWTAEVEQDLPTVRIRVADALGAAIAGVRIFADGVSVPPAALAAPVILEAGPHQLRFEAPGYEPIQVETALRPTDRAVQVAVVLRPLEAHRTPAVAKRSGVPALSLAFAGVGVLAGVGALYFGVRARDQYRDLKRTCAPLCNPADADSMYTKAVISDVALAVSAVAFGASAWFYFSRGNATEPSAALSIQARPDGAQLGLRTSF